jgi:hypothetical protein
MVGISLNTLAKAFGINSATFIGRTVVSTQRGKRRNQDRIVDAPIKSITGDEFAAGNGYYETQDFCLGQFTLQDLEQIVSQLEKMIKDYRDMRNYLKERGETMYDVQEIGVRKVLALIKKSNPEEGTKLLKELMASGAF